MDNVREPVYGFKFWPGLVVEMLEPVVGTLVFNGIGPESPEVGEPDVDGVTTKEKSAVCLSVAPLRVEDAVPCTLANWPDVGASPEALVEKVMVSLLEALVSELETLEAEN